MRLGNSSIGAAFEQNGAAKRAGERSRDAASVIDVEATKDDHVEQGRGDEGGTEQREHDAGEKLQCMHFDGNIAGDLDIEGSFDTAIHCLRRHVFSEASVQLDREEQVVRRIQNTVDRLRDKGKVDAKQVESRIMRVSELISRARATMYMADAHCQDDDGPHVRR